MARQKGSMQLSANFEVKAAAPLDSRYVVSSKSDLTASATWEADGLIYLYVGMQVYVSSEQKLYMLISADYTDVNNWRELAAGGSVFDYKGSVATFDDLPDTDVNVGDLYYVTDEETSYYWNETRWVPLGSPDKSSYVWKTETSLGNFNTNTNVLLTALKRSDDETIIATSEDILVGKTIVIDAEGIVGTVVGLNGTTEAIIKTMTINTKSDGIHLVDITLNNTVGSTTTLTDITLTNLVLNETLVYDAAGTVAVITAEDSVTGNLTATTITKVQNKFGDTFISSILLSKTTGATTNVAVAAISDLALENVVLNNTLIADISGTLGVVTGTTDTEVVVKTLTANTKSDGVYKTTETLDTTISNTTTIAIENIVDIITGNIVENETLIYDAAGTLGKVISVNIADSEIIVETITSSGEAGAGRLANILNSSQNVGGVKAGDSFAAGIDLETIFRAILDPVIKPTFTSPSATLSVNGSTLLESGSVVDKTFTATFNRGSINPAYTTSGYRSGPATGYSLNGGASQEENTWTETVSAGSLSFQASVSYSAGEQPVDSAGENYDNPYPAGSVNTNTIKFEFVDALWGNTVSIDTIAKLALVSKTAKQNVFNFPEATVANPETFDVPTSWTISAVEVKNDLTGSWDDCSEEFSTSNTTHPNADGTDVNYTRYICNLGYDMGVRQIRIKWN